MAKRTCLLALLVTLALPAGHAGAQQRLEPTVAEKRSLAPERQPARWALPAPAAAASPSAAIAPLPAPLPQDTAVAWPWGWMARGLVGGLVAGPIGTAVAYNMVGGGDPGSELDERIRARRKEAVVVGGMVGTAVLAVVLLRFVDLDGVSQGNGGGQPPEPA